ncbi:MAG: tripartite tricarboxylate transporter TctB family protein [Rhizobiales bacterium]|nr:tripartite tricarboxylate transporter TctB family protein [Hyphomicrobiales bacterium]MBO6698019.1 tripartite tricarboxylate transporter TctB family protein [Hyphomicrobiales bacterium]MBO6735727.1 tripartite tricarboxylate transporter TctB family protein [Hyphomicrobiales bacterium]MBO6910465.1 tripartite tricarboxylate transporter TctB family protein [Hyphomicrobiales bacterium]
MTLDSATADRWTSLALFAIGLAMLVGGYTMDRLEIRQIHPASIPGLVPMILGAAMMLCAVLLFLAARAAHIARNAELANLAGPSTAAQSDDALGETQQATTSNRDLFFAAAYSVLYALALVGSLPFAQATAIYIALFYTHFTWQRSATTGEHLKRIAIAIAFGVIGAYAIASLFQYGFLVRLP